MSPTISVIIPVFNAESTIERCIDSVLNQTMSDFNIILVNDGSLDNSGKICNQYKQKSNKISVYHQENKGVSSARNLGLNFASGKYVFFLDCDDKLYPNAFEEYIGIANRTGVDAVLGSMEFITDNKSEKRGFSTENIYGENIWEEICLDSSPFGWAGAKLILTDVVGSTRFNEELISQEDLDFNLDIYNSCNKIVCSPFSGYQYYYVAGKRKPQIIDYINNQIKLLSYAQKNYKISNGAKKRVLERISNIIYTALYTMDTKKGYYDLATKISCISGLLAIAKDFKDLKVNHASFVNRILNKDFISGFLYTRVRRNGAQMMNLFRNN